MSTRRVLSLVVFCAVVISLNAFAVDPPGLVARLDYVSGQVSIQPNGVNDWVQASINRPLTSSDRVWTDKDSRAELQMGAATARLDSETSLTLANVSYRAVQLQLDQGALNLHVMQMFNGEVYEIDTPNVAFTIEKSGDYRLDVDNAGDSTVVTVWKGRGEASGDSAGVRIGGHQQMTFRGGRSLEHVATNAPGLDGFDTWCQARADREDHSASLQYVSPNSVGYSDLDQYGQWETIAPYGPIWVPAGVAPGWAPYRWGQWVYIAPWGWTWVDDSPWGFAPYHYGRWVSFGSYWGWAPGPIYARPIYAPALVGWVGGPRFGLGLSFGLGGGIGWFPLGWGEPFVPWYHGSRAYFQNVNVTNTHFTNITSVTNNYYGGNNLGGIHYVNRGPNAVTAVSNATFTGSRPTRESVVPVSDQALRGGSAMSTVPFRPTRESIAGTSGHTAAPPSAAFSRPLVTKMTPPAAPNVSAAIGRPERGSAPVASGATAAANGASRSYPHPPQANPPSRVADEQAPRGIPNPQSPAAGASANATSSRVPRPPAGGASAPANTERNTGPASRAVPNANSGGYPHPTTTPAPAASANHQEGTSSRPQENRSYGPSSTPHESPAPRATQPSHESHPEPKSDKSNSGRSGLSYTSPNNGTVRSANFRRAVPHPTGPVAAAPRSYSQVGYGASRTYPEMYHNTPSGATYSYRQSFASRGSRGGQSAARSSAGRGRRG